MTMLHLNFSQLFPEDSVLVTSRDIIPFCTALLSEQGADILAKTFKYDRKDNSFSKGPTVLV